MAPIDGRIRLGVEIYLRCMNHSHWSCQRHATTLPAVGELDSKGTLGTSVGEFRPDGSCERHPAPTRRPLTC